MTWDIVNQYVFYKTLLSFVKILSGESNKK